MQIADPPFRRDLVTPDQFGALPAARFPVWRNWSTPPARCRPVPVVPWPVIRRKLRFVGLASRDKASPHAFRWQRRDWPAALPARAVVNVSVDSLLWGYLGNWQHKLTVSFHAGRWFAEPEGPRRGDRVRIAPAEAAGLVAPGRDRRTRALLVRTLTAEPAYAAGWLRAWSSSSAAEVLRRRRRARRTGLR